MSVRGNLIASIDMVRRNDTNCNGGENVILPGHIKTALVKKKFKLSSNGVHKKKHIARAPDKSGVYALYYGKTLQYIGKSDNIHRRVSQHNRDKDIPFGSFAWYRLPPSQLLKAEDYLIGRYKPRCNVYHT